MTIVWSRKHYCIVETLKRRLYNVVLYSSRWESGGIPKSTPQVFCYLFIIPLIDSFWTWRLILQQVYSCTEATTWFASCATKWPPPSCFLAKLVFAFEALLSYTVVVSNTQSWTGRLSSFQHTFHFTRLFVGFYAPPHPGGNNNRRRVGWWEQRPHRQTKAPCRSTVHTPPVIQTNTQYSSQTAHYAC